MNLYEPQSLENEKIKSKKQMKGISAIIAILFIMSICLIIYIFYVQKNQLKLVIDDAKVGLTSDIIIIEDNKVYISLSDIASKIGYRMNNGEYKEKYLEDVTKCHLANEYEAASYIEGSEEIYKTIISENRQSDYDYDYYTIDAPVFSKNKKLYTTLDGLGKGCNLATSYNPENNTVKIYTLDYLAKFYSAKVPDSKELIEDDDLVTYKNKKAILYNMMVVKSEDGRFGVNTLKNEQVIGEKYKSITFMELLQEFVVETEDGRFGIIDKAGDTKINPKYSSIKQIEKEKGFYLVSINSDITSGRTQYGIINKNEKNVVYLEYDQIGINKSDFPSNLIDNPYFLYGKCIPVKKSNKWGLLDINGNTLLPIEFDGLGCKANSSKNSQANSLLLVPAYEAVVVNNNKGYGLFSASGIQLIPAVVDVTDMYSITYSGETKYYLTHLGNTRDIINYLKNTIGIEPVLEVSPEYDKPLEEVYYPRQSQETPVLLGEPNANKDNTQANAEQVNTEQTNTEENTQTNTENNSQSNIENDTQTNMEENYQTQSKTPNKVIMVDAPMRCTRP